MINAKVSNIFNPILKILLTFRLIDDQISIEVNLSPLGSVEVLKSAIVLTERSGIIDLNNMTDLVLSDLVTVESLGVKAFTLRCEAQNRSSVLNKSRNKVSLSAFTDPNELLIVMLGKNLDIGWIFSDYDLAFIMIL